MAWWIRGDVWESVSDRVLVVLVWVVTVSPFHRGQGSREVQCHVLNMNHMLTFMCNTHRLVLPFSTKVCGFLCVQILGEFDVVNLPTLLRFSPTVHISLACL